MQLYFAIALKISRSILQYKLMNKWRITKTVWPNDSISSPWIRNSTYVSSSSAFACVCSLKACFLVITVITHFNGWLDLSHFCKFNEMPSRESTWKLCVQSCFYWRIISFHIWFVLVFRDRGKEEGVPDALAAKLNTKFLSWTQQWFCVYPCLWTGGFVSWV